jgi:excisionase family DNA binding protein
MSEDRPLFVRLPAAAAEKLDRAAFELRLPKKEIVAALVSDARLSRSDGSPRRVVVEMGGDELTVGRAEVRPIDPPEVLTPAEVADLLQVPEEEVAALAERGELPARRIAGEWRFSRAAVLAWLAG